jgi:hypothetical protein
MERPRDGSGPGARPTTTSPKGADVAHSSSLGGIALSDIKRRLVGYERSFSPLPLAMGAAYLPDVRWLVDEVDRLTVEVERLRDELDQAEEQAQRLMWRGEDT